ncbi:DNA glycosylase [Hygrophoropsis aurantiaca]|uniref:DNA glycosylase n=1 Tax=Hygrophoropsis aurantiaca TaxID=72124 RepID=A0ACB7ZWP4_9AGAM|nr:DNA glycosylase [Hygrophoropsis aurantiaca]
MSSVKRSTRLAARASPYHASVTLFEATNPEAKPDITNDVQNEAGPSTAIDSPRRSKRIKLEVDTNIQLNDLEDTPQKTRTKARVKPDSDPDITAMALVTSPLKSLSPKKKSKAKPIPQSLATPHPAPARWKETYDIIKEMRSHIVAPVDTMGCDQAQYKEQDPKNQRFATLVSLMLSSQTKDEVTDAAVTRLREAVGGMLSVQAVIAADESTISEAIAKVGFWRRKTQYIKQTAQRLYDDFDADVPKTVDELCSLPGVGPKMAFLALQVAWNLNVGIGVDVHVHRITNRLGWHQKPTRNPEETRLNLQSWLPTELHPEINHLLVGFGQMICLPVNPKCGSCQLSSTGLCPSAQEQKPAKSKSRAASRKRPLSDEDDFKSSSAPSGPKLKVEIE